MKVKCFVVLDPTDEVTTVKALEFARDHVLATDSRLLLLLSKDGLGFLAVASAPALASFVRADHFGVNSNIDRGVAMADFQSANGTAYDEWLRRWRAGTLDDSFENNLTLAQALSIESES